MIISNKHGIYVLPHGLPNDLRLLKTSQNYSLAPSPPPPPPPKKKKKFKFCQYQQKILRKQKLNYSRRVLFHRKITACLKYFGQDCSCIPTAAFPISDPKILSQLKLQSQTATLVQQTPLCLSVPCNVQLYIIFAHSRLPPCHLVRKALKSPTSTSALRQHVVYSPWFS